MTSRDERLVRINLAACFRLAAHFGWEDLIYTHISARVPGRHDQFFMNPLGVTFAEIKASDLVKVDFQGEIVDDGDRSVNKAGFVIHSAVHRGRPDVGCVIHLHTLDGVAVSALAEGLLPLNQSAISVAGDLAFHDYEGPALNLQERERLIADLGDRSMMILRNHGTLAVGSSPAEAFHRMYFLERACSTQVRTLSMGRPLHHVRPEVVRSTQEASRRLSSGMVDRHAWGAMLRMLDRQDPTYRY